MDSITSNQTPTVIIVLSAISLATAALGIIWKCAAHIKSSSCSSICLNWKVENSDEPAPTTTIVATTEKTANIV